MLVVPGSDLTDTKTLPPGALAQGFYDSTVLDASAALTCLLRGYGRDASTDTIRVLLLHGPGLGPVGGPARLRRPHPRELTACTKRSDDRSHARGPTPVVLRRGLTQEQFVQGGSSPTSAFRLEKKHRVRPIGPRAIAGLSGRGQSCEYRTAHRGKVSPIS